MASTLKINTLTGVTTAGSIAVTAEGNSTTTNLQQGLCKVWCHWNGASTPSIDDSLNTASITDTATGRASLNFSNNFGNGNYVGHGTTGNDGTTGTGRSVVVDDTPTTSAFAVRNVLNQSDADTIRDDTNNLYTLHGDLA